MTRPSTEKHPVLRLSRKASGAKVGRLVKAAGGRPEATGPEPPSPAGARLARIASVEKGKVYVDFEGNPAGPLAARTTVPLRNLTDDVLILLLPGGEPVIVGQLFSGAPVEGPGKEGADVVLKGRRVRVEAESELVLVSGSSKIHLDSRGKAVTTAPQIVSRASGTNKVQGGCVRLN